MKPRKKTRRLTCDAFHEEELAQMQHIHELVRNKASSRRHTFDVTAPETLRLPPLRRRNVTFFMRPCRTHTTQVRHRVASVVEWKDSLRRGMLRVPPDNPHHRRCNTHDHTCDEVNQVNGVKWTLAKETEENVDANSDSVASTVKSLVANDVNPREPQLEDVLRSALGQRALETLQRLFLPRWRLYMHLIGRSRKPAVAKATPQRRRSPVREVMINVILLFLRSERLLPLVEFRRWKAAVTKIQRAFRQYKKCLEARVELNYLKLRSDVEQQYWMDVAKSCERETEELGVRNNSVNDCELDVADFYLAGPLPESMLRRELHTALRCHLRRTLGAVVSQQSSVFLPMSSYYAVLDNACYITSVMRNSQTLRSHLCRRPRLISIY
ncbi:hypothetical protein DQ04_00571240 [Trypanosoma grayi]|uniref:hypothetical protein n=1 Tax=Trypanosoma grayi TaxID=71804 RepID=UPI0004F43C74|nr:hypothetical protein DQ04_00571240 [Trypanosoma grayi]KEG14229.1 hypothetical protein DQ04_00571240 [Trypanosoma grayi]